MFGCDSVGWEVNFSAITGRHLGRGPCSLTCERWSIVVLTEVTCSATRVIDYFQGSLPVLDSALPPPPSSLDVDLR